MKTKYICKLASDKCMPSHIERRISKRGHFKMNIRLQTNYHVHNTPTQPNATTSPREIPHLPPVERPGPQARCSLGSRLKRVKCHEHEAYPWLLLIIHRTGPWDVDRLHAPELFTFLLWLRRRYMNVSMTYRWDRRVDYHRMSILFSVC